MLRAVSPRARDEPQFTGDRCRSDVKVRLAAVAARQYGRVRYDQIRAAGVSERTLGRWTDAGYLHPELPRVYAVGHAGRSTESDLAAALLYAGPGAMLSHATAIWWLELLKFSPATIHVSTPRRVKSRGNIVAHGGRTLERSWQNGFPVTTVSQALLDFAAIAPPDRLRLALANADYHGLLDLDQIEQLTGRGINGSAALRAALKIHQPQLARTRSELERRLLALCEAHGFPIPCFNVRIEGWLVDAMWPQQKVIVELDGLPGHRTRGQLERDHQRYLELRRAGYLVLRYTWRQLEQTPQAVASELAELVQLTGQLRAQAQHGLRVQLGDA